MDPAVDRQSRPLTVLLFLTVAFPALAVLWGFENKHLVIVLYREPKMIAVMILGWSLVTAWLWTSRTTLDLEDIRTTLSRPPLLVLAAFIGYLATTGLWVWVPQNYWYELNQYLLLFVLLVVLLMWQDRNPAIAGIVRTAIVSSLAVVTAVGLVQTVTPLTFLSPINPEIGTSHPSFMGYKNPAALAVLGQIFILAGFVFTNAATSRRKRRLRLALGILLVAELVYLASLESRTSTMAFVIGGLFTTGLWWARHPNPRQIRRSLKILVVAMAIYSATLMVGGEDWRRAASMWGYLAQPTSYLDSDRGTYLVNTLDMVRHHPLGVGLGDWQTHYPLHRPHDPTRSFTAEYQVRRAHSDHLQFLGEAGWPGIALWTAFLLTIVWMTSREFFATGRKEHLFVAAQLVAFAAAMCTDYVTELPYNKAQFFLIVFLAIQTHRPRPRSAPKRPSRGVVIVALAATAMAAGQIVYHAALARSLLTSAHLERSYAAAIQAFTPSSDATQPLHFAQPFELGLRFASDIGHTKTRHKDWLVLADCAQLVGRHDVALAATRKTLDLHPTYPSAYLMMSKLESEPEASRRWLRAHKQLIEGSAGCPFEDSPLDLSSPDP